MAPRAPHPCATHLGLEPLCPCATHPILRPPRPCVTHPGPWPPLSAGVASRKNPSQAVGSKKQEWSWLWSTCTRSSRLERDKTMAGSSLGKAQAPQGTSEGSRSQMQILQEGPAAWECKRDSNLWGRQNVRLMWGFTHRKGLAAGPWRGAVPGNHPCFSWSPRMPRVGSFQSSFSKLLSHRAQIQLF